LRRGRIHLTLDTSSLKVEKHTAEAMSLSQRWIPNDACKEIHICPDGTCGGRNGEPAYAFVAIKNDWHDTQSFGGYFAQRTTGVGDHWLAAGDFNGVPQNECAAVISALAWALQAGLSKDATIVIMPDAKYSINNVEAKYTPRTNKDQIKIVHALADLVRANNVLEMFHLKSHREHPWNDFADTACKAVGDGAIANSSDVLPPWSNWTSKPNMLENATLWQIDTIISAKM
jgi:ribonuclease HI